MSTIATTNARLCLVHGIAHPRGWLPQSQWPLHYDHLRCEFAPEVQVVPLTDDEVEVTEVSSGNCEPFFTLSKGDLAYIDTFGGGLVPVKVRSINAFEAQLIVTAKRPGYLPMELVVVAMPNNWVVNRNQVHTRRGQYRITGHTRFITDEGVML